MKKKIGLLILLAALTFQSARPEGFFDHVKKEVKAGLSEAGSNSGVALVLLGAAKNRNSNVNSAFVLGVNYLERSRQKALLKTCWLASRTMVVIKGLWDISQRDMLDEVQVDFWWLLSVAGDVYTFYVMFSPSDEDADF